MISKNITQKLEFWIIIWDGERLGRRDQSWVH